jgi:hypothetical protein
MRSAQWERSQDGQLRRFMDTCAGRSIGYGRLLVEALDLGRVARSVDRGLFDV